MIAVSVRVNAVSQRTNAKKHSLCVIFLGYFGENRILMSCIWSEAWSCHSAVSTHLLFLTSDQNHDQNYHSTVSTHLLLRFMPDQNDDHSTELLVLTYYYVYVRSESWSYHSNVSTHLLFLTSVQNHDHNYHSNVSTHLLLCFMPDQNHDHITVMLVLTYYYVLRLIRSMIISQHY